MNKTEATKLARKARSGGHFDSGRTLYVFCPLCRSKVEEEKWYGYSKTQQLDRMMVDHLMDDERCNAQ